MGSRPGRFGVYLKKLRMKQGLGLREFCLQNGFDPGNYSRLERGLFPPPQKEEKLKEYATALSITLGSEEWIELFDLAAVEKGRIPADILSDEDLLEKLPVMFRTMRGQQVSREKLDEFVEKIRRS